MINVGHTQTAAEKNEFFAAVCPAIFGLVDGSVSPSPCTSNVCTFKCLPGYVLSTGTTSTQLICQDGGTWNDDMPKCIREFDFIEK